MRSQNKLSHKHHDIFKLFFLFGLDSALAGLIS
jgi:hypothetical protein